MAEHGEWNRKGATISDVTAAKEYGVDWNFILTGIRAGKLEYRDGSVWGNPYLKVLRRQLEQYVAEELGADHLLRNQNQTELRKINKEMAILRKRLDELQARKTEMEKAVSLRQACMKSLNAPGNVCCEFNPKRRAADGRSGEDDGSKGWREP